MANFDQSSINQVYRQAHELKDRVHQDSYLFLAEFHILDHLLSWFPLCIFKHIFYGSIQVFFTDSQ
jgi:hypothetical protein